MKYTVSVFAVLMILPLSIPSWAQTLTDHDKRILDVVASERGLTREETILLYSVRSHEAGKPGLECGIEQPCARYYTDGFISLIVQADYAAWIIKERYRGNIGKFSRTYHHVDPETDAHWAECVRAYAKKYRDKYFRGEK